MKQEKNKNLVEYNICKPIYDVTDFALIRERLYVIFLIYIYFFLCVLHCYSYRLMNVTTSSETKNWMLDDESPRDTSQTQLLQQRRNGSAVVVVVIGLTFVNIIFKYLGDYIS